MARLTESSMLIPALWIAFFTFFAGLIISLGLESIINAVQDFFISFLSLGLVILAGIISDAIGTAATAADMVPFNAMAAKKIPGANQAVRIVRNADLVANLTADVVGDIAGTLSGAIGASIVFTFDARSMFSTVDTVILGAAMTSLIAALTVGGKTVGKSIAINNANSIILRVARFLMWWEDLTGIRPFQGRR